MIFLFKDKRFFNLFKVSELAVSSVAWDERTPPRSSEKNWDLTHSNLKCAKSMHMSRHGFVYCLWKLKKVHYYYTTLVLFADIIS